MGIEEKNYLLEDDEVKKYMEASREKDLSFVIEILPYSNNYGDVIVPERFREEILCHIISPYIRGNEYYKSPIYLVITGEAGEGKTSQTIATCTKNGFYVLYVSASALSGSHENEAKNNLLNVYNKALQYKKDKKKVVILIDDFHKGIINEDDNIKKTINSNILTSYMMNIAEYNGTEHIPIILTANDLTKIYAPLLRAGRADIFKWSPNRDEKKEIVKNILKSLVEKNDDKEFNAFFNKFYNENIAFFSQLKNQKKKELIKEFIKGKEPIDEKCMEDLNNIGIKKVESYSDLISIARDFKMRRC